MTEKKAIEQLKFDMEMITFDPDTGEHISLEVLKSRNEDNYKTYLADELAIKALEEIKLYHESKLSLVPSNIFEEICKENDEYKAIGTPDECRAAVEKQIPKKITHPGCFDNEGVWHTWNGIDGVPYDLCPNCDTNICTDVVFSRDKKRRKYCENCGQKLDWSEEQ